MQTILVVLHLLLALGLIGLVLMQHGKGADAGAAFGAGASGTVFGASGAANFLSRSTAILAALFFVTSLALAWFSMQSTDRPSVMQGSVMEHVEEQPAPPVSEVPAISVETDAAATSEEVPVITQPEATSPAVEEPVKAE